MATIASRLTNTGTLLVNGSIDEVTFSATTPTIKNLLTYSEQFNNAAWTLAGANVSANVSATLSPIGTQTASKIYEDTTTGQHNVQYGQISKAANAVVTFSVYAKAAERSWIGLVLNDDVGGFGAGRYGAEFDLAAGATYQHDGAQPTYTNGSQTMVSVGNGWYRCSITCTTYTEAKVRGRLYVFNNTTGNVLTWTSGASYTGNGSSGVYAWGAQIEIGSGPTIYQPIAAANTLISGSVSKQISDTIYAAGQFDEVTFNSTSPVIKNLLKNTQQLGVSSYWYQGTAATVSANVAIAPDGTLTADKIVQTTTSARHGLQSPTITILANTAYTLSCFAKAAENNYVSLIFGKAGSPYTRAGSTVNLTTGAISANYANGSVTSVTRATPVSVGNGWWFIAVTVLIDATSTDGYVEINTLPDPSYQGSGYVGADSTSGTYVWGVQLEAGTSATIYQPISTTSTVDTPPARKIDNAGNQYVSGTYDEFTGAPVIDSSVVLWLDAGQSTSYNGTGSTWTDLSGKNNTATIYGSYSYVNGVSLNMNGGNAYLSYSSSTSLTSITSATGVTVVAWIKNNAIDSNYRRIYSVGGYPNQSWYLEFNGAAPYGRILSYLGGNGITTSKVLSTATWYNVCHTYGSSTHCVYINGVLDSSNTDVNGSLSSTSTWLGIFADPPFSGSNNVGEISAFQMYNRALSADEVAQNFNALRRRYGI